MRKLKIDFENCYGIASFKHEFEFLQDNKTQIIYAPNGSMKSSFTKSFEDISKGGNPRELIYGGTTSWKVKVDGNDIDPINIYAIRSEPVYFESEKISTLLVNEEIKKLYDIELEKINNEKFKLITYLKGKTGIRGDKDLIVDFTKVFAKTENDFYSLLEDIFSDQRYKDEQGFGNVDYTIVFDEKVKTFLETKDFKKLLSDYITTYDELLNNSKYFKKGVFNHNNAEDICKSLKENKFFEAEHLVILKGEETQIDSISNLQQKIDTERNKIFNDAELKAKFDAIDKAITKNSQCNKFRNYIETNTNIITKLQNVELFRQDVLISYLQDSGDIYINFLNVYISAKVEIKKIIQIAKRQSTEWGKVVNIFNKRFDVPFTLSMENQDDVILKSESRPQIAFNYKEPSGSQIKIQRDVLLRVLSTGEQRALYILNVLFEIEARKTIGSEQILIIDDIADSFDYRNKYAIIEYLKEIAVEQNGIFLLILTHNYDFYRSIQSRFFGSYRKQSFMVLKSNVGKIQLEEAKYLKPFDYFRTNYHKNKKIFIATIPFVRNLVEYSRGMAVEEYKDLTCVLHQKKKTPGILVGDIKNIFDNSLGVANSLANDFDALKKITDFILEVSDSIILETVNCINLENKIVLSISIRLLAEKIMLKQIVDPDFLVRLDNTTNQTAELFKKYKVDFPAEQEKIKLIEQVMLITPENIHINSFMYEPILDLGEEHLKSLYINLNAAHNNDI